jgi:hypothetical protein
MYLQGNVMFFLFYFVLLNASLNLKYIHCQLRTYQNAQKKSQNIGKIT